MKLEVIIIVVIIIGVIVIVINFKWITVITVYCFFKAECCIAVI